MTWASLLTSSVLSLFFATPLSSTNYTLKAYDLGGGSGSGSSTSYKLDGTAGGVSGAAATSTNYNLIPGSPPTKNAYVPSTPTLTNPSTEYSRLLLVLNTSNNATDTIYAIAISSDDFSTTQYVKADTSIGSSLAFSDYQTYASWGGASGFWITCLSPSTTYKVKVKAMQGDFSETAYGPATGGVATVTPSLSFGLATNPAAGPPYSLAFTSLTYGVVTSATRTAELSLSSNAVYGGNIYVYGQNSGLTSVSQSYTLSSATTDLATASGGYGAQVGSVGQSSGGPIAASSPFNGADDNIGILSASKQAIAQTSNAITGATVSVSFKAKSSGETPPASDYSDTITFLAAMLF